MQWLCETMESITMFLELMFVDTTPEEMVATYSERLL
jgi:hypothetical protein